jgi:hypothetical protein
MLERRLKAEKTQFSDLRISDALAQQVLRFILLLSCD